MYAVFECVRACTQARMHITCAYAISSDKYTRYRLESLYNTGEDMFYRGEPCVVDTSRDNPVHYRHRGSSFRRTGPTEGYQRHRSPLSFTRPCRHAWRGTCLVVRGCWRGISHTVHLIYGWMFDPVNLGQYTTFSRVRFAVWSTGLGRHG